MATTRYPKPKGSLRMTEENNIPINTQWRQKAACKGESIDSFFPVAITKANIDETTRIYSLCERCPVIVDCMHEALLREYDGIWARSTAKQRQSYVRHVLHNDLESLTQEQTKIFVDDLCRRGIAPTKIYVKRNNSKIIYEPTEESSKTQSDSSNDKDI